MAQKIQIRRGSKAASLSIIFDVGEIFFLTDTLEFGVGDGFTAGGIIFAKASPIAGGFVPAYNSLSDLQDIVTAGGVTPANMVAPGIVSGALVWYQLRADTTGLHPDDYDASTNAVSWHQVL